MRRRIWSAVAVGLAGAALGGTLTVEIEDGERWWGGLNARGFEMPYGRDSLVSEDLARDHRCNVAAPLLLSSHGRYVWSDEPFAYTFSNGTLTVTGRSATPTCGRPAADLRGAFACCSRTFFPPKGKAPPVEFFAAPQWNTWIELTYNQNEKDILAYAEAILAHGFKPGLLMIDDTWQAGYGTWTFDAGRFRDPKAMCERLHALGFKVMLWTCPFVSMDSPAFRQLEKAGGLVRRRDGRAAPTRWWNGCSAMLDLTHPNGAKWFADQLTALEDRFGVDGFKFDAGDVEYYNGDDARTHLGEFVTAEALPAVAHTQKYVRFGERWRYNEFRAAWGAAGEPAVVRLCDKNHAWSEVRRLIPDLIATGLLGYPFVCPDMIGGGNWKTFLPGSAFDPELFVRSAQVHALAPMAQFSAAPWRVLDARHLTAVRRAMEIRERFSARIVDLARACAASGEPMLRNLEYAYPGLGYADVVDAFMLGDFLLVAPQVEKGAASRSVRLPPGRWRADDGVVHDGPTVLNVETPLERLPYFEKVEAEAARQLTATWGDLGGTDHLGRMLPSHAEVGDLRPHRQVGLFYYLWLGQHGTQGPYDVSKMEAADPQVLDKPDSPLWPDPSSAPMLHWGEPLFGYYQSTDEWVLRRHVEMFIAAGIDVLFFDTTNGYHYREVTDRLFPILQEYQEKGFKVPKFCYYMAPGRRGSGTSNVLDVWLNYYRDRKFESLYFMWDGKPLLIAHPDRPYRQEIRDFFTWRRPTWGTPSEPDTWYWAGMPTQNVARASSGAREMMALTVGSPHLAVDAPDEPKRGESVGCSEFHWGRQIQSRSWHDGALDRRPQASEYGFFFKSQVDWALDPARADVPLAFVCQWNEWIVPFLTRQTNIHYGMPHWLILQDEYNQEASRDIEPMRGGYRDAYYFQLMDFVRRFKGLPPPTVARKGDVVAYVEPTGDLAPRNHPGYDACGVYRNATGRNEFARLFVSCDGEAISFTAQTVADLTPCADATWMNLLVRVPGRPVDALGYTLCVTNGASGVACRVARREVAYRLPLRALGLDGRKDFSLEFKWSDNRQADDPMDFYVNGDAAPRGRLNWIFRYQGRKELKP